MKPSRYVPGVWKGEPDGLQELRESDWKDIMTPSRAEREERERKDRERNQSPNATEPL
jgi:hypothetical protein